MRDKMVDRVDWRILKWLGHVERERGKRLTKRLYKSEVEGRRNRGVQCEDAKVIFMDREQWRDLVNSTNCGVMCGMGESSMQRWS